MCIELATQGVLVHALCRDLDHPYIIHHENIQLFKGDITNKPTLITAMNGCNEVYYIGALAKMWCPNVEDFYTVNVLGTRNVLKAAIECAVQKVVYTSTCGVLGSTIKYPMSESDPRIAGFPINYERTKYLAELEVADFAKKGLLIVIVNPSKVYCEGSIIDSNTVSKMEAGYMNGKWRIIPGNGEMVSNYVYLDDVVNGHIAAMKYGSPGHRYILGGENISINNFF